MSNFYGWAVMDNDQLIEAVRACALRAVEVTMADDSLYQYQQIQGIMTLLGIICETIEKEAHPDA